MQYPKYVHRRPAVLAVCLLIPACLTVVGCRHQPEPLPIAIGAVEPAVKPAQAEPVVDTADAVTDVQLTFAEFESIETEAAAYTAYTPKAQPGQAAWSEAIRARLAEAGFSDVPVVIREAWAYAWEGQETVIVTASNAVESGSAVIYTADGDYPAPVCPAAAQTCIYSISVLLRGEEPPILLHEMICPIHTAALGSEGVSSSYAPPMAGTEIQFDHGFSVIQTDENGAWITCPVFTTMQGELDLRDLRYTPTVQFGDADGDGSAELLFSISRASSVMCVCKVYTIVDGHPLYVFSVLQN